MGAVPTNATMDERAGMTVADAPLKAKPAPRMSAVPLQNVTLLQLVMLYVFVSVVMVVASSPVIVMTAPKVEHGNGLHDADVMVYDAVALVFITAMHAP